LNERPGRGPNAVRSVIVSRLLALVVLLAAARADAEPIARIGAMIGVQQTDRSAWVFGPSLEIKLHREFSIRGEAHLELGDIGDPFGDSNIRGGTGPHVNHVMFGPTWRPGRLAEYAFVTGASGGVMVMHSRFAVDHFQSKPAFGMFVQAGRRVGPLLLSLQARVDVSATIPMAEEDGGDVTTTTARLNFAFEFPIDVR
jgi:hypothetical protein